MFIKWNRQSAYNTVGGRRDMSSITMRKGYCHSLIDRKNHSNANSNAIDRDRCREYVPKNEVPVPNIRGSWQFEQYGSPWIDHPEIATVHAERQNHAIERVWDRHELEHVLFVA
mmetsp:Transcript_25500/g.53726  ORF Transcript_25500/g.53726 Transcript_25500/m.53726 type:complete len:114 (+) Transcript_25500:3-344(+)